MARPHPAAETGGLTGWLLPVAVLVLGFGWEGAASTSSAAVLTAEEHARYCKCKNCRIESCCCAPRPPKAPEASGAGRDPAPPAAVVEPTAAVIEPSGRSAGPGSEGVDGPPIGAGGPCMGAAPCGDPGLPPTPNPGTSGDSALPSPGPDLAADPSGALLLPGAPPSPPAPPPCRLDEPPEAARRA